MEAEAEDGSGSKSRGRGRGGRRDTIPIAVGAADSVLICDVICVNLCPKKIQNPESRIQNPEC